MIGTIILLIGIFSLFTAITFMFLDWLVLKHGINIPEIVYDAIFNRNSKQKEKPEAIQTVTKQHCDQYYNAMTLVQYANLNYDGFERLLVYLATYKSEHPYYGPLLEWIHSERQQRREVEGISNWYEC